MATRSILKPLSTKLTGTPESGDWTIIKAKSDRGETLTDSEKAILNNQFAVGAPMNPSSSPGNKSYAVPGADMPWVGQNYADASPLNSNNYQSQVPTLAGGGANSYAYNPVAVQGVNTNFNARGSVPNSSSIYAGQGYAGPGTDSSAYQGQVPVQAGGNSNAASLLGYNYGGGGTAADNAAVAAATNQQDRGSDPAFTSARDAGNAANSTDPAVAYEYKQYPTLNLPDAPISKITPQDFSVQAGAQTARAYAPSYAALDTGRSNVGTNYTLADKVVGGLYANLATGNTNKSNATAAQYAASTKAGAADAAATQKTIGAGYQASQSDEAKTLASLGIQAAAPGALKATSNAQTQQQGIAAQNSANQAAGLKAQAANQNDYQSNVSSADVSQGLADRSSLLNARNTTLGQYDAQQQVVAGEQGQQALTIGQGLTSQDLTAQQTNANLTQQQYSNTVQQKMNEYNAGIANMQYQDQQNATQYNRMVGANSANVALNQQNWQNNFDTNQQQGNLSVDAQNANSGTTTANAGALGTSWDVNPANPKNAYSYMPVNQNSSPDDQILTKYKGDYVADPTGTLDMLNTIKGVFNTSNGPQKGDSPLAIKNAAQNAYKQSHPNATQNQLALVGEMGLDWINGVSTQSNTGSTP